MIKKIKVSILTLACLLTAGVCFAHPPQSITLEYNLEEQILKMDVKHISNDQKYHYIRTIKVFKNNKEVEVKYNRQQVQRTGFEEEFTMEAEEGDELSVKLYCSEGGTKSESIVVTEPVEEEE